jgi:aminopeptidase YwaD
MNLVKNEHLLFLTLLFFTFHSFSQTPSKDATFLYARQVTDTLASPSMHGRGYVNGGDQKAAKYMESQFASFGLRPFGNTYEQEFHLNVNTFPGKMQLEYITGHLKDDKPVACIPGIDYLVDPASPSVNGLFPLLRVDSSILFSEKRLSAFQKKKFKHVFLFLDTLGVSNAQIKQKVKALLSAPPKGVVGFILRDNLSMRNVPGPWDVSQVQGNYPLIISRTGSGLSPNVNRVAICIEATLLTRYKTQNVIGYIPGTQYPDSFVVFSAHYDHLGQMGQDTYFPGANDNASGCAMLLSLAKYFSEPSHAPKCSIAFMAFSGEEAGLLGSAYYTDHPLFPLKQIRFLSNLDILGTGDEGITVVNGTLFIKEFSLLQSLNAAGHYLPEVRIRGKAANSDHYYFSEKGVKAFFIYTRGGIKAYHDVKDKAETLPLTKFSNLFQLLTHFEESLDSAKN